MIYNSKVTTYHLQQSDNTKELQSTQTANFLKFIIKFIIIYHGVS